MGQELNYSDSATHRVVHMNVVQTTPPSPPIFQHPSALSHPPPPTSHHLVPAQLLLMSLTVVRGWGRGGEKRGGLDCGARNKKMR
jgi:hypothetical protein